MGVPLPCTLKRYVVCVNGYNTVFIYDAVDSVNLRPRDWLSHFPSGCAHREDHVKLPSSRRHSPFPVHLIIKTEQSADIASHTMRGVEADTVEQGIVQLLAIMRERSD